MAAFSFVKILVQTRAKAHTAIGTVCYRFALQATSTLDTPVRQWPTEEETRAFDEAEKRRVAAAKAAGEKTRRRRLLPKLIRMDPPRHYDFRGRVGIVASGSAVPEGGAEAWRDPLEWAVRVEAADGRRLDARQCRDDVMGIPLELVRSRFADLALARQAAKVAALRQTPVHWVIHRPHGSGLNWHAHLIYAGRQLSGDGEGFESKRDVLQDKPELIETHKALWVETCREFGVEISFDFPGMEIEAEVRREFAEEHGRAPSEEDERAIQIEKRRRWQEYRKARASGHELTPRAIRTERAAVAEEEGERLAAIIQGAGGSSLSEQDRLELGRISSAVDELDTRELLALERIPVTTVGRLAKHGSAPEAPLPVPAHRVEPPRPRAAPVVAAPVLPATALAWPAPMPGAVAARPAPSPGAETPVVPISSIAWPAPVPSRPVAAPRPDPAPAVEAPLFAPRAFCAPKLRVLEAAAPRRRACSATEARAGDAGSAGPVDHAGPHAAVAGPRASRGAAASEGGSGRCRTCFAGDGFGLARPHARGGCGTSRALAWRRDAGRADKFDCVAGARPLAAGGCAPARSGAGRRGAPLCAPPALEAAAPRRRACSATEARTGHAGSAGPVDHAGPHAAVAGPRASRGAASTGAVARSTHRAWRAPAAPGGL